MKLSQRGSVQSIVLVLIVLGVMVLALGGFLAPMTRALMAPLIETQTWLATRFSAIQDYFTAPQDLNRLRQRNAELEAQVAQLQTEIIDLKQQIAQTRVLEALVEFSRANPEYQRITAQVIGRDPSPFMQYVLINAGSNQGLRRGMPVVTQQGLVGRIAAVSGGAARVQLITDPGSLVNVRLEDAGVQAVLQGNDTGEVTIEMAPQSVEIFTGDLVLTSGLGGNYPPDLVVGEVAAIRSLPTDLFKSASIQPSVDFSQLEIVLVITNFSPIDTTPLLPTVGAP